MDDLIYPDPNAPRLTSVEVIGPYVVRVVFSDGTRGDADLSRSYRFPDGRQIGDSSAFALVRLHEKSDTLLWPDGFHVHGEMLYEDLYPRPVGASS